jgi:hypothetical protein
MKNRGHRRKEQRSRKENPFENGGFVTRKETASSVKTLLAAIKQKVWFPWQKSTSLFVFCMIWVSLGNIL